MKLVSKIEKIVRNFYFGKRSEVKTTSELDKRIIDDALPAYEQSLKTQSVSKQPNIWRIIMQSKLVKLTAAAVVIISAVYIFYQYVFLSRTGSISNQDNPQVVIDDNDKLYMELETAKQMFAQRDIAGLAALLDEGLWESKIVASSYLAKIGDSGVITSLEQLQSQWQGNSNENPFSNAIKEIKRRIEEGTDPLKSINTVNKINRTEPKSGLSIQQACSVTLKVLNEKNKELLPDIRVRTAMQNKEEVIIATGNTDKNGQCEIILPPGDYKLLAQGWKNGQIYQFTKNFTVDSDDTNTNVEIEIQTRPIIHGWLVDSNDSFLQGAVTLDGDTVETNGNGEFFVPEPWWSPGDTQIMYAFDRSKDLGFGFFWERENDINDLIIVLQPTVQIKGRIIDVNGQGLGDIEPKIGITIHDQGTLYNSKNPWTTKVEKDGRFIIENLPVGLKMVVSVEKPGYFGGRDLPDLNPGQILELGYIQLKAKTGFEDGTTDWTGILTGYVTNETGEPMHDIKVWADGAEGVSEYRTDSNGYFELTKLPKGKKVEGGLYADGYGHNSFKQLIDGSELNIQIFPQGWELLNKPAPLINVDKWLNTEAVTLEQYKGKVILLQVGVLLPNYQDKFDKLQDLLSKYSDKGLQAIVVHEPLNVTWAGKVTEQDIRDIIKKNDIKFPFGIDYERQKSLFRLYKAKVTPATYLIDKKGILRMSPKNTELEEWVKKLLDE